MDRRQRRLAWLAALLLLGLPAVAPPASGHPFHLMIDNGVVGSPEAVDSGRWVGQSIVPVMTFVVTRVSLNVEDTGSSDVLFLEIRDVGGLGFPGSTILASGSSDGPGMQVWLDIDVTPPVFLSAGTTYWIVASSAVSSGYDWWNSNDDSAYGPGTAATSADGFTWSGAGKDYSFRVYGYSQPSLTFSASASSPTAGPGQSVTFRANFTNAGPGPSAALWVNVTLPPQLTYVGDDAASIGGVPSGTYDFAFANVAPGTYSFNLTAVAASGIANGTLVSTVFAFEGTDHNGVPLTGRSITVSVEFLGAVGGDAWGWWFLALAVALVVPIVFLAWTRGKLEEVFLVGYSGILLAHLSNTMKAERDRDLLTGMLTAVQDFIRDSFVTSKEGELRRMDFGERTIHICRGAHSYLAVVVRGRARLGLQRKMEETLQKLEKAFPESLVVARVDGRVLDGAGELLGKELLGR